jgi:hypothetical protein
MPKDDISNPNAGLCDCWVTSSSKHSETKARYLLIVAQISNVARNC